MDRLDAKQPYEAYYIEFDFSAVYEDQGETALTIDSVTVTDLADDSDVSASMYDDTKNIVEGLFAFVWIYGGTDGHEYEITVRAEGDTYSEKYELEALMRVQEKTRVG
jgi:hypothetical protein